MHLKKLMSDIQNFSFHVYVFTIEYTADDLKLVIH